MVMRLVGPLTTMAAAPVPSVTVPSPGFLTGFGPITTLPGTAPSRKATGTPATSEHGQRLLAMLTRLPPVPLNATAAPEMFTTEPPLALRRGPDRRVSEL